MERACFAYASPGSWGGHAISGAEHPISGAAHLRGHLPHRGFTFQGCPEHPIQGLFQWSDRSILSQGRIFIWVPGVHPFEGPPSQVQRAGHLFGAAYSPGGGTWPVQRGHLSLGLPGTSHHTGRLSRGCPEQSKRAAFLHMHCSHLSGLRCGTLVGWWHVIDLGTTWLVDDLRPRFSFQLSETARRRRRVVWALGLHEHTCGVGMGWCFVYRERMQIRDCLLSCAVPCARKIAVENAGTVAPHQLDQLVF